MTGLTEVSDNRPCAGQTVTAQLSGRMRRFHIRVITGDRVQCGVSPYDPSHGFITYREPPGGRPSGAT